MLEHLIRIPILTAALCLTIYWGAVLVKLIRLARKIRKDPNAIPREPVGQLMRVLWYPDILVLLTACWMVLSLLIRGRDFDGWRVVLEPVVPLSTLWMGLAYAASAVCIWATAVTFVCWRKMGRSWRIGIDPGEKLELVSTGPYRLVRHPIYALRILLNLCVIVMVPVPLVALTAGIDIILLQIEARREEKYMESTHGAVYANYKKSVGRFVPRWPVV